jgi:glycosyltransferase involved in cell wall biosynthesis
MSSSTTQLATCTTPKRDVPVSQRDVAVPPHVYCISHVYAHHASSSGYHRLSQHLGEVLSPSRVITALGETVLRVPAKLISSICGVYEYSRHNCIAELHALIHMSGRGTGGNSVYHFLYGEKGYRLSGMVPTRRNNRLVASFHYPPSKFYQMVRSTRHIARLDHAIAVSTNQLELLESLIGKGRVTFVPHGVDTAYWYPLPQRQAGRRFQCVFAGSHMRDVSTLERVVDVIESTCLDVEFVLLTKDARCASLAERSSVRWLKRTSDEDYRAAIQQADLMVLPLTDSTAVNSVLEALACGLPVVTTDGGVADYLNDRCAVIHRVGDAKSIADSVIGLLNDERKRSHMSIAARDQVAQLEWSIIATRVRKAYAALF